MEQVVFYITSIKINPVSLPSEYSHAIKIFNKKSNQSFYIFMLFNIFSIPQSFAQSFAEKSTENEVVSNEKINEI